MQKLGRHPQLNSPDRCIFWALLCLQIVCAAHAIHAATPYRPVHPDPVLDPWRWRTFPETKGLGLRCMIEGNDGSMWFGTEEGVQRYDGIAWTAYRLKEAPVVALCATRDGNIYAGTDLGISRFRDGMWRRAFPETGDLPWPVYDLQEGSDGSLWAGTAWGALRMAPDGPILYTAAEVGNALQKLGSDIRLVTLPEAAVPQRPWPEGVGAAVVEGGYVDLRAGRIPPLVWALAPDAPATVAGLTIGDRILSVNGDPPRWDALSGPAGTRVSLAVGRENRTLKSEIQRARVAGTVPDFRVFDVYEDRTGALWFGLMEGEVLRYTSGNGTPATWRLYTGADGLDAGHGPRIIQTRDGAVWTVYRNHGSVNRFADRTWTHTRLLDVGSVDIHTSVLETSDGALWIGGHTGALNCYRNGAWTVYGPPEVPLPQSRLIGLVEASDGALWIGGLGQEAVRLDYGASCWASYDSLSFRCETPDGALWFTTRDSGVVRFNGAGRQSGESSGVGTWMRYDEADGLMDFPNMLIPTRDGELWATGSHRSTAATARFDPAADAAATGPCWSRRIHAGFAQGIDHNAVLQAADGCLWFGAFEAGPQHTGGMLRFDGQTWKNYPAVESQQAAYAIGQTPDGSIWIGRRGLRRFDGHTWASVRGPRALSDTWIHDICVSDDGDLWVGTRHYGIFRFNGHTWRNYGLQSGLADNHVDAILQAPDGSIWAATSGGYSRFDGRTWETHALPTHFKSESMRGGLRATRDGSLWLDVVPGLRATRDGPLWQELVPGLRYRPDTRPPDTEITLFLDEVSRPGNTTLTWRGADPWRTTPDESLHYAWRLDGGAWSSFARETSRLFTGLRSGAHTFEVKARDRDFNTDPTPAAVHFTVVPPIWQNPWFIGLMILLLGAIGFQTVRVFLRDQRLMAANDALHQEIEKREQLDTRLQELRYLYQLRLALGGARSAGEVVRVAGETLMAVLVTPAEDVEEGVQIRLDDRSWQFGAPRTDAHMCYERDLVWGDQPRGRLSLCTTMNLSESQERTLLDETAGQLVRVLEARELEMQLLQSARLVSLGEMAAGVVHELNQPLAVILGSAEDVSLRLEEGAEVSRDLLQRRMQAVVRLSLRMADTVDHLRTFSRDTSQEPGVAFSINAVIQASLNLVETQLKNHGVTVRLDLAEGLPAASGHPHQMEQVFLNLLNNGRDALDERAETEGELRDREKRLDIRTRYETADNAAWVVAEVSDSGTGIDASLVGRVFDPFFTTKPAERGTGLGLSISYAIVKNHNGRITCESRKGEGTTFRVMLPALR